MEPAEYTEKQLTQLFSQLVMECNVYAMNTLRIDIKVLHLFFTKYN